MKDLAGIISILNLVGLGGVGVFLYYTFKGLNQRIKTLTEITSEQEKTLSVVRQRADEFEEWRKAYKTLVDDFSDLGRKLDERRKVLLQELEVANAQKTEELAQVKAWFKASVEQLEQAHQKAVVEKEEEYQAEIEAEIRNRETFMQAYAAQTGPALIQDGRAPSSFIGTYSAVGRNYQEIPYSYVGEVSIQQQGDVFLARWIIGPLRQRHDGYGVAFGNRIAFAFASTDQHGAPFQGVVLYEMAAPGVMRGIWTQESYKSLGTEECRRLDTSEPSVTTKVEPEGPGDSQ